MLGGAIIVVGAAHSAAFALEKTTGARQDRTIRHVVYDPNNVVPIRMTVGIALMIVFGADEHIVNVAPSDSKRLIPDIIKQKSEKLANYLYLKPAPLVDDPEDYQFRPQTMFVVSERNGELRHYQFRVEVERGEYNLTSIIFDYPQDEARKRREEARERERLAASAETKARLTRETNLVSGAAPPNPSWNYSYSAKGDFGLAPAWLWDDGFKTFFHWPAMQRIPSIFRGYCNTNEATADSSTHNDVVIVPGTAPVWCLRGDQFSAIEIYNLGYTVRGQTPGTGTVSPDVEREVKGGH